MPSSFRAGSVCRWKLLPLRMRTSLAAFTLLRAARVETRSERNPIGKNLLRPPCTRTRLRSNRQSYSGGQLQRYGCTVRTARWSDSAPDKVGRTSIASYLEGFFLLGHLSHTLVRILNFLTRLHTRTAPFICRVRLILTRYDQSGWRKFPGIRTLGLKISPATALTGRVRILWEKLRRAIEHPRSLAQK